MKPDLTGCCIAVVTSLLMGCAGTIETDPAEADQESNEQASPEPASEPAPIGQDDPDVQVPAAARTPLPIVLLHGAAGFDRIGPLKYYYGVADALTERGFDVFTTKVDPMQVIEVRAEQLADQIDAILAETGASRVHLIAHSQGGLDARFLISSLGYGDRIATLTTVSTPHLGSRVADVALGLLPGDAEEVLGFLFDIMAGHVLGSEQDAVGQIYELTEEYQVHTFNPANPDDPRVQYFSIAGVTQTNPLANPFSKDLCDLLLMPGFLVLQQSGSNDGMISVASATRGTFLGTIPADHLDEIGQLLGRTGLAFNHRAFYLDLARFLTDPDAPAPLGAPVSSP